jgi:hypothetical protein
MQLNRIAENPGAEFANHRPLLVSDDGGAEAVLLLFQRRSFAEADVLGGFLTILLAVGPRG